MIPIRIRGRVDVTKEYERLVLAASALDATHFVVLLRWGGGLRGGEMIALEWRDVDLVNRQVCVTRSDWNGHVTTPKGGRLRYVPLTSDSRRRSVAHQPSWNQRVR